MPKGSIPRSRSGRIKDYLVNRSNIGRPFRAVKGLIDNPPSLTGPIRKQDIERSFDAATLATAGSMAARRPPGSLGTGGRQYKVSGATPQVAVTQPKPGSAKFIGPVKPKATSKTKAQAIASGSAAKSSAPRYAVSGAQQTYTAAPKPGSAKFIGPTRATQPGEKGFIGPINRPSPGQSNFIGPVRPSTSAASAAKGSKKGLLVAGGVSAGVGLGLGVGGVAMYKSSQQKKAVGGGPKSRQGKSAPSMAVGDSPKSSGSYSGYGNRTSSAAYGYKAKSKTNTPSGSTAVGGLPPKPKKKPEKKAGATTGAAPAKPKRRTNLERMRKRQAERFAIGSSGRPL